jgi:phospholipase/carboxylesterase
VTVSLSTSTDPDQNHTFSDIRFLAHGTDRTRPHVPPGSARSVRERQDRSGPGIRASTVCIGRPVAESLNDTTSWFRAWLDSTVPSDRQVVLVGFSGGAAFAGGLILADQTRYQGAAILYGTLPFDAGLDTEPGRLDGLPVFLAHGDADTVIPFDLLERTWTYLSSDAASLTTAVRDAGGHGISQPVARELSRWLTQITSSQQVRATSHREDACE